MNLSELPLIKKTRGYINDIHVSCGVYCLYNQNKELLYIGSSKNIKPRLSSHKDFAYVKVIPTKAYAELERELIIEHTPIKNIQHTNNKKITIVINLDEKHHKILEWLVCRHAILYRNFRIKGYEEIILRMLEDKYEDAKRDKAITEIKRMRDGIEKIDFERIEKFEL